MTISVVQTKQFANATSGSFTSNVTAGNSVVMVVYATNATGNTISTSNPLFGGSSVTGAVKLYEKSQANGSNNAHVYTAAWLLPNLAGGAASIAITLTNGSVGVNTGITGYELSGLGAAPSEDKTNTGGATTGTAMSSGASGATVFNSEFVIGSWTANGGSAGVPGAPWTSAAVGGSNVGVSGWQIQTAAGSSYTFSGTQSSSTQWAAGVATIAATLAPPTQPPPIPRRVPARAYVRGSLPAVVASAATVIPFTLTGGLIPYAGGVILQTFSQTFTSSGSWTAPANLAAPPSVYAWGPSGTAATGTAGTGAGGGGGGGIGGEPSLGGVAAGTVLTVTVGAAGSGNPTTVTGGNITVQGNAGGNASVATGGTAGAASSNTVTFAGGTGGNGAAGGSGGGGGGGGSAGSTGAGGNGGGGSGSTGGAGGLAGTGNPGGAAGGAGGTGSNGSAGTAPGGAGGGGSGGATHTGGAATAGQVLIAWQTLVPVQMAMQRRTPARARVQFTPVQTTNTVTVVSVPAPTQQPRPAPRRIPARAYIQFTPVRTTNAIPVVSVPPRPAPRRTPARAYVQFTPVQTTNNTAVVAVPAPIQQPRPAPRRTLSRAYVKFTPVHTTNAAPVIIPAGPPPVIPTSGGDRSPTIRVFREIKPGDVPTSGAQLPKLTGRAFAMPVAADVEHVTHAWDETLEDETPPVPAGPSLLDQARTELDELAKAARDAADAIDRAADRARPIVEGIGSKAYDLGKIFGSQPYDPRPRKVCGATRMTGGVVLTCQRKPHDDGWHSDKGLHWR